MNTTASLDWPDILPAPIVDGYGIQPSEGILRTNMDSGSARQRRIFTQTPSVINLSWLLNDSQYQTFEGWYQHMAKSGAAWFNIGLKSGLGIIPHVARFKGQVSYALVGQGLWKVAATLEIDQRPVMSASMVNLVISNDLSNLIAWLVKFNSFAGVTIPRIMKGH